MAPNKVKGVRSYESRGKIYHYHRATGARLRQPYGSAAFLLEVAALDKKQAAKAQAGTLARLIDAYKASDDWNRLAPKTKLSYERAFAAMAPIHGRLLKEFTPPFVAAFRDVVFRARKRWMANYVLTVMIILFDTAREKGWVESNPAKGIRRVRADRNRDVANRPWTPAESRTVLDAAPAYLAVPIALAMFAAFRKNDVLTLKWSSIRDGKIVHKTEKRGVEVTFPIHPTLANVLSQAPAHKCETIAATSRGKSWTETGFNSTFCKFIARLERAGKVDPGLTMHGLRHACGTRLVEAGAPIDTVRRLLGQKSLAMAQHYSATADVSEHATALVGKMKVVGERS